MTFGYPLWLWALLVLPLLAFFFARAEQRGAERLQQFVAARLMPQLAGTVNRARRIFRFILLLLVFALVIVSLARPRVGYTFDEVRRKGLDLILAVDVSRSMLSNDVSPNRLERVKLATQDLINELQGDRVGLIAFAGRAFLQAPLTIDYDAAVDSINDLDTKSIPEGGTNISDAIALATRTYGKAATGNRALIIFTDGEELNGDAVAAARAAADAGVRIFTVGVGTQGGSLIPIQGENGGTAFVKDEQGQVVKSKLDETRLREIAKATNGFYLHLENGPKTMQQLFSDGLGKMKVADINARMTRHPIERYEWPLAGAIFLFAIALLINDRKRRNAVGGTGAVPASVLKRGRHSGRPANVISAALLLILVRHSQAASAGLELYDQQKFPEAYQHFEQTLKDNPGTRQTDRIEFDAGAAAYKMKDYNKAMQSFSQALLSKDQHLESAGHYNLGNTLYERGEAEQDEKKKLTDWENALQHYSETLKAEPKNKEAKDNYDYVKKKIDDLKKKQEKKPTPPPTPTPSPSPQKNQQNDKNQDKDQQNKDQQNKDQQNKDQKNQGGGTGQGQQQQKQQQTPTPTPTATPTPSPTPRSSPTPSATPTPTPSPSPGDKKQNQNGGQTPTPTPTSTPSPSAGNQGENSPTPTPTPGDQSPTPSNQGTPTPTPGGGDQNGDKNGQTPTPTPAGTPGKAPKGEVKGAGEEKPKESPSPAQAEAEPEKEGEMSPKQARRLLESMKDEEQKVQLDEHRAARPVYKDW